LIAYDCVQSKDSFYIDFVLQSIIKMFVLFWVWQGVGSQNGHQDWYISSHQPTRGRFSVW